VLIVREVFIARDLSAPFALLAAPPSGKHLARTLSVKGLPIRIDVVDSLAVNHGLTEGLTE
jgi:hypothetical protein